jgi:hypothetical protein
MADDDLGDVKFGDGERRWADSCDPTRDNDTLLLEADLAGLAFPPPKKIACDDLLVPKRLLLVDERESMFFEPCLLCGLLGRGPSKSLFATSFAPSTKSTSELRLTGDAGKFALRESSSISA